MKKEIFLQVDELLGAGKRMVLAVIIRRAGSAPRAVGSQCIILEDGSLLGTIGGGLLEHRVLERAKDVFRQGESVVLPLYLTGKDVAASEMICGGNVEVYLDPLFPDNRHTTDLFRSIREMIESGRHGTLLSRIADGTPALEGKGRMLLEEGVVIEGEIEGLMDEAGKLCRFTRPRLVEISELGMSVFVEPVEDDPVLFLFGAGHVSTFVAPSGKDGGLSGGGDGRSTRLCQRGEIPGRGRDPHRGVSEGLRRNHGHRLVLLDDHDPGTHARQDRTGSRPSRQSLHTSE